MRDILLHLSLIEGIGPAAINRIVQNLSVQQISQIYSFKSSDFVALCGVTPLVASKLEKGLGDKKIVEREEFLLEKYAIKLVTILDSAYPAELKQIYLPPVLLYIKGQLQESKALAVVGSRKAHAYAQRAINLLLPPLIAQGWRTVSGGALGADTFAHQITLKEHGITTVVLGSGLLRRYPSENNSLFDSVVNAGGALISCFPLEQMPLPGNFPARNRIIAGISRGCLVVQAAKKSGASITALHALEQGKEVFVVPGAIDDPLNEGSHALIQQGAKLVHSVLDIMSEYDETLSSSTIKIEKKINSEDKGCPSVLEINVQDPFLMLCKQPISIEDLAGQSGHSLFELQSKLFDLQLEGKISQNFAGLWHSV